MRINKLEQQLWIAWMQHQIFVAANRTWRAGVYETVFANTRHSRFSWWYVKLALVVTTIRNPHSHVAIRLFVRVRVHVSHRRFPRVRNTPVARRVFLVFALRSPKIAHDVLAETFQNLRRLERRVRDSLDGVLLLANFGVILIGRIARLPSCRRQQ